MPAGGLYDGGGPRGTGSRRKRPVAGIPKAPGLQNQGTDRDALKALYMQKKRRR